MEHNMENNRERNKENQENHKEHNKKPSIERSAVTYCEVAAASPGPFFPYLLPHIASQARKHPEQYILLGAVWNGYSIGAAAVFQADTEASLESLFVDPKARGQGIGMELLCKAVERARAAGADTLRISYCLAGPDLEAFNHMVRSLGGEPEFIANVYTFESRQFLNSPLFGWAIRPGFLPAANVVPYSELRQDQIDALNRNEEIPYALRPETVRELLDPEMSLAWVEDGQPTGILLNSRSEMGSYVGLSVWRSSTSSGDSFIQLLAAFFNLCYYDGGGDFLYHISPLDSHAEKLVQEYSGGLGDRREEYRVLLDLDDLFEDTDEDDREEEET